MCILGMSGRGFVLGMLLVAIVGCGRSNRAAVDGHVTLDGKPVEDGTISFIPPGESHLAAWGKIKAGSYSIPARNGPALGTSQVEVRWPRKTGRKLPALPPAPATDEVAEAIPDCYNKQSKLKAEIKPGANQVDFDLKTK